MAKEQLAGESKHGQFNRDQGRQAPSGEDTALMIDCNTSSSTEPESKNCDHCTSLSHNNQRGYLKSVSTGLNSLSGPVFQILLIEQGHLEQNDPKEHNRAWMTTNNIPSTR